MSLHERVMPKQAYKLSGSYEKIKNQQIEIVWQSPAGNPKGVVFLAHGCAHAATDWWPKSESCPLCIGLPIEMSIVRAILLREYVAIAVSSIDRESKCWMLEDKNRVSEAIKYIYSKLDIKLNAIPLFAFGASSGGYFVSTFGSTANEFGLTVSAICMQISTLHSSSKNIPPVMFVYMHRDRRMAMQIPPIVERLTKEGVPASHHACYPLKISPSYFQDKGNVLSLTESEKLTKALVAANIVDPNSGLLLSDPLSGDWTLVCSSCSLVPLTLSTALLI